MGTSGNENGNRKGNECEENRNRSGNESENRVTMGTGVRIRVGREWKQVGMRLGTGKGMSVKRMGTGVRVRGEWEWEQEWE